MNLFKLVIAFAFIHLSNLARSEVKSSATNRFENLTLSFSFFFDEIN